MYCPNCGEALPAVTGPTQRKLICTACGREEDLAIAMQMERTLQVFSSGKAPEEPGQDELIGKLLGDGRYRIDSFLGRGGMGTVYRGTQIALGREVAIKVLSPQLASDEEFIRRFRREAATLATFNHPHIVTIHDTGSEAGLEYIVMAYFAGSDGNPLSLRQVMASGPLEGDFALRVIAQTCSGLQYAHDKGIIHRDIKPENILLDADGNVHIADFGIARAASGMMGDLTLTASGAVMGTLKYMAPEQKAGATHGDVRSDLYSLGVVFYEMLTGQAPEGRFALPSEIRKDVDRRIDGIVERTLHRTAERRYQTAAEMAQDLSTLTVARDATLPLVTLQPGEEKTKQFSMGKTLSFRSKSRHSSLWVYGTAGGLIILVMLIGGQWYRSQEPAVEGEAAGAKEQQTEAENRKNAESGERVAKLLQNAEEQRAARRLTTPVGDNALETYQEVLRVVPGHERALHGIREIKEQYLQWAEAAKQREQWANAQRNYERALAVDPQDKTLVAALQQLKQAQNEAEQRKVEEKKREAEKEKRRPPSGLTIASLTRSVRNSSVFPEHHHTFTRGFESVWVAVHRVLQEGGDQIARSNQQSGVIITNLTRHRDGIFLRHLQYYILVEEEAIGSTKVSFKLFTYFESLSQRGTLKPTRDVSAYAKRFVTQLETVLGHGR